MATDNEILLAHLHDRARVFTMMCGFGSRYVQYSNSVLMAMKTDQRVEDLVFEVWKQSHRAFFDKSPDHYFFMPSVAGVDGAGWVEFCGFNISLSIKGNQQGYFYFVDMY
jgi:hypothetical protein